MKKRAHFLVFLLVIIIIVAGVLYGRKSLGGLDFLAISDISCSTQYGPCGQEDYDLLNVFLGRNFLFLSTREISAQVLTNFKNQEVAIHKVFPGKIEVQLEKRKGVALIVEDVSSSRGFLVSSDGYVLSFVEKSPLPVLEYDHFRDLFVGERLDQEFQNGISLLYLTGKIIPPKFSRLWQNYLSMVLETGTEVYYPLDRDPQVVVGALQLITSRSKMNEKDPSVIDLRYRNPVLRY